VWSPAAEPRAAAQRLSTPQLCPAPGNQFRGFHPAQHGHTLKSTGLGCSLLWNKKASRGLLTGV